MAEGGTRREEGGVPNQGSVSDRQDLWENASTEASTVMKWLGYGPEIRKARRDAYREKGKLMTELMIMDNMTFITVGSKGEGLTSFYENDEDILYVSNDIICLEDGVTVSTFHMKITVFRSFSRICYPGHCRLLLERMGSYYKFFDVVREALCDDGHGRELLSSGLFINKLLMIRPKFNNAVLHDRAGPRPRHWPPTDVVQKVVSLGAYLTPVGFKGSEYQHVEWRVCFNTGEIELVCNLNATQVNLYVLLKMVKNDVLKPRRKEVTSFTMKNIVLWIAERTPQTLFHERSLIHWLHEGLNALRVAILSKELPYFMIPERNLMEACGLEYEQQKTWISTITEMMNEGPRMILRLPKIRQSLIAHPEPFRWYSKMRIELEMVGLRYETRRTFCTYHRPDEKWVTNYADVILQKLIRRSEHIVWEVFRRMIMEGSQVTTMQDVLVSMLKN